MTAKSLTISNLKGINSFREKLARTSCMNCNMCQTLQDAFLTPVVSRGDGRIMFIGATVTPDEHKANEPFTGPGGRQADSLVSKHLSINTKNDCYWTNLIKCRGDMDVRPLSGDKRECGRYLLSEIARVDPIIITFFGSDQAKVVLGKQSYKIGQPAQFMIGGVKRWAYVMNNITATIASTSMMTEIRRQLSILRVWLGDNTSIYTDRGMDLNKKTKIKRDYKLVNSAQKLEAMVEDLSDAKLIGLDTETNELRVWHNTFEAVGFCLAKNDHEGYYIPVGHCTDPRNFMGRLPVNLSISTVEAAFKQLFGKKDKHLTYFNIGYDYQVLKTLGWIDMLFYDDEHGIPMYHDAQLLWYLLDENISQNDGGGGGQIMKRSLKVAAKTFLGEDPQTFKEAVGEGEAGEMNNFMYADPHKIVRYAADDAMNTWALTKLWFPRVKQESDRFTGGKLLGEVYPMELRAALVFADMNMRGMGLDGRYRAKLRQVLHEDFSDLSQQMARMKSPVSSVQAHSQLSRIVKNQITGKDFFLRYQEEYKEEFTFNKDHLSNLQRFYRKEWDKATATNGVMELPGNWSPDDLDKWLDVLGKMRKIKKLLSSYIESDKVNHSLEEKFHMVKVVVGDDGKITHVITPGWKQYWGDLLPDPSRMGDEIPEGAQIQSIKARELIIHGSFRPNGTTSGRSSANNPNFQNLSAESALMPKVCEHCKVEFVETDDDTSKVNVRADITRSRWTCKSCGVVTKNYIYDIRKMYIPHVGYWFAKADWDAQEIALMAAASGCPALTRLIKIRLTDPDNPEGDLHTVTAAKLADVPVQEFAELLVSKDPLVKSKAKKTRKSAKIVNFGIMYGTGAPGLWVSLLNAGVDATLDDAKSYIDAWFELFPGVEKHNEAVTTELNTNKRLVNMYGRVRHTPYKDDVLSARNFLIQGPGAVVAKMALVNTAAIYEEKKIDAHNVNLIHDEIFTEYRVQFEKEVGRAMHVCMNFDVPGKSVIGLSATPEMKVKSLSKGEKAVNFVFGSRHLED